MAVADAFSLYLSACITCGPTEVLEEWRECRAGPTNHVGLVRVADRVQRSLPSLPSIVNELDVTVG